MTNLKSGDILATQVGLRSRLSAKLSALKAKQEKLRRKISRKLNPLKFAFGQATPDIIVSHCEVNNNQGVGILLSRLFTDSDNIFSLRSRNLYDGRQKFGFAHACLSHSDQTPELVRRNVSKVIGFKKARCILTVPYYTDDILSSLALKELLNVPLCTYLMDDQNIYAQNIPDELMRDLLEKSDLRLGISRELCQAYEQKYNFKFWFLPPVVDTGLIQTTPSFPLKDLDQFITFPPGVLIGNIWSQQWLERLKNLTRETGFLIDWYGNPNRNWLSFDEGSLKEDGITFKGFYPEDELLDNLRKAPYALILTGSTNDNQDRPELAKLSLPSRIPYLVAATNIPLIVVGSRDTAAAKFVEEMQLGVVCDYTPDSFSEAVLNICSSHQQQHFRQRAAYLASSFSAENMATWIWRSLERGRPINFRFEQLGTILSDASAVITAFEINQLHGTGPLVQRIIEGTPNVLSIHSMDLYDGEHYFGDLSLLISHEDLSRVEAAENIINRVGDNQINQILCVPYRSDDLITAITLTELHRAPLGTYIMDDQNVCVNVIPDPLMHEFLDKCSLRLATHPELRDAYEAKYGLEIHLLPAVVPHHLICQSPESLTFRDGFVDRGVLIGSIWSKQWFDMLSTAAYEAGLKLDWYGNTNYPWMQIEPGRTNPRGINPCGLVSESTLVERMRQATFVVVPTGTLDSRDDRPELSRLSLPGRIIFAMATSNTPIIIMGSRETPASNFVKRFGVGVTCDYSAKSLREAVNYVSDPQVQQVMRQKASLIAPQFSADQLHKWLWESIQLGRPSDLRFEDLFFSNPLIVN